MLSSSSVSYSNTYETLHLSIIFGIPNGTKNFPKSHREAWFDVIPFNPNS